MKYSLCFASILLIVLIMPPNFSQIGLPVDSGRMTAGLVGIQRDIEWGQEVPAVQEATPGPTGTLEAAYPIEPGTSPLGIIIGAVIIVLTVLGGVVYANLMRRKN